MRKPRTRPTKAQREQAAREEEAQNASIRAQHEESERAVKERADEEERARAKADDDARAERVRKDQEAEAARQAKRAEEKAEREAIDKEIEQCDLQLAVLAKAESDTVFEYQFAMIDLTAKPTDEHHAKAKYLLTKTKELHELTEKCKNERKVLEGRRTQIGLGYDALMGWLVALAAGGSAYWMTKQWWGAGKKSAVT